MQNDILKIIQSDRVSVIQKYIEDYLILLRAKINDLTIELATQSSSCPSTLPPFEVIDTRLKEFVRLHHIDLLSTIILLLFELGTGTDHRSNFVTSLVSADSLVRSHQSFDKYS